MSYTIVQHCTPLYLLECFVGRFSLLGRVDHQARGELAHGVGAQGEGTELVQLGPHLTNHTERFTTTVHVSTHA